MKIKLDEAMKSFDGTPVNKVAANGAPEGLLIMRELLVDILLRNHQSEQNLSGSDKVKRFELARTIHHAESEYEFSHDDISIVKQAMLDKNFPVMVVGTLTEMFNGKG